VDRPPTPLQSRSSLTLFFSQSSTTSRPVRQQLLSHAEAMPIPLQNARVLLTGATGGIGHAIARALRAEGADLVLTGRRVDVLQPLADELSATSIAADLAKPEDVDRLLDASGQIDVLVANAALPGAGDLFEFTEEQIDRALAVNLRAPIVMTRRLAAPMIERGAGHIVLIGSLSGLTASPLSSIYSATKFGLRGFALGFRQDLHGTGVGVSHILPGFVRDTGMFIESGMELPRGVRTVSPEAVADAVLKAVARNRPEIVVAPVELRIGAVLGSVAPGLAATVQRLAGAADLAGGHTGSKD
jgi:short-subunit dehydrogenase